MYHFGISHTGRFLALALQQLYTYQVGGYMRSDNLQLRHITSKFLMYNLQFPLWSQWSRWSWQSGWSQAGQTGKTKLTFKLYFSGNLFRAAFAISAMFLNVPLDFQYQNVAANQCYFLKKFSTSNISLLAEQVFVFILVVKMGRSSYKKPCRKQEISNKSIAMKPAE